MISLQSLCINSIITNKINVFKEKVPLELYDEIKKETINYDCRILDFTGGMSIRHTVKEWIKIHNARISQLSTTLTIKSYHYEVLHQGENILNSDKFAFDYRFQYILYYKY